MSSFIGDLEGLAARVRQLAQAREMVRGNTRSNAPTAQRQERLERLAERPMVSDFHRSNVCICRVCDITPTPAARQAIPDRPRAVAGFSFSFDRAESR